jgi:hypothetical protein
VDMLLSLPPELRHMVMQHLGIADLFRMRRVHPLLKQMAESLLSKTDVLSLCVNCGSDRAVVSESDSPSLCLLIPGQNHMLRLMPAVKSLCVWPRFSTNYRDESERKVYAKTLRQMLRHWSGSLESAEFICEKDHKIDMTMPKKNKLIRWAMTQITPKTMHSLLTQADGIQEIVYLKSDFQSDQLVNGWKVMEKTPGDNQQVDTHFLDLLFNHQKQFENVNAYATS